MTTNVEIKVNGRYCATVKQDDREPVIVMGNYIGSPNPEGKATFFIGHSPEKGSRSVFEVTEEYVPDEMPSEFVGEAKKKGGPTDPAYKPMRNVIRDADGD